MAVENVAGKYEYPNLKNIESAAQTVNHVPGNNELDFAPIPRSF